MRMTGGRAARAGGATAAATAVPVLLLLAAAFLVNSVHGFLLPVPAPHRGLLPHPHQHMARRTPMPSSSSSSTMRLWIKGQPLEEDPLKTESFLSITTTTDLTPPAAPTTTGSSPQDMVRNYAAANGVDARQQAFLVNTAFIVLVAAVVLAKVATVDLDSWRGWTPLEIFFRMPLDNWGEYMDTLTAHPIFVKAVTSGSVYALGDGVAQLYEGKTLGELDRGRVARSAAAGFIGHGPLSHFWYGVSEGFFDWLGWEGWWTTFPKITVDQLVWGPIWNGCYIFLLGAMRREGLGEIIQTVKGTSFSLLTSGLKLWPLAHVVTYGLIPVENRLLWVDLVEILWVTILSREAANADTEKLEAAAAAAASADGTGVAPAVLASSAVVVEEPVAAVSTPLPMSSSSSPEVGGKQQMQAVPVPVEDEQQQQPL